MKDRISVVDISSINLLIEEPKKEDLRNVGNLLHNAFSQIGTNISSLEKSKKTNNYIDNFHLYFIYQMSEKL